MPDGIMQMTPTMKDVGQMLNKSQAPILPVYSARTGTYQGISRLGIVLRDSHTEFNVVITLNTKLPLLAYRIKRAKKHLMQKYQEHLRVLGVAKDAVYGGQIPIVPTESGMSGSAAGYVAQTSRPGP